jgi:hypothetical protein
LEFCTIFCELNQLKNDLKLLHSHETKIGPLLQCQLSGLPRATGRPGHGLAARVLRARRARFDVVTMRSPRAGRGVTQVDRFN